MFYLCHVIHGSIQNELFLIDTYLSINIGHSKRDSTASHSERTRELLVVGTELLNVAASKFDDTKESVRCSRVFVITELVVSGTQCVPVQPIESDYCDGSCRSDSRILRVSPVTVVWISY